MASQNQRVVKLKVNVDTSKQAGDVLQEIHGVDKVEQLSPQNLRITYNVNHTSWYELRERLQAIGAYRQNGRFVRWRDGWRDFIEQNMRANLNHRGACCSKPPAGGGLRSRTHRDI